MCLPGNTGLKTLNVLVSMDLPASYNGLGRPRAHSVAMVSVLAYYEMSAFEGVKMDTKARIKYSELVDVAKLQVLMESLNSVIGTANAVIDVDGEIIVQSGWQRACKEFHRSNLETCRRCIDSDTSLVESMMHGAPYAVYNCLNGLVDTAAPIMVDGQHVANVFTGQILTGPPDVEFFRGQARQAGFDEERYLAAIAEVPIVPLERIKAITALYAQIASMLADNGMDRLKHRRISEELSRLNEELEARVAARTDALSKSEARLQAIMDASPVPNAVSDDRGRITYLNAAFVRAFGYTLEDIPALTDWWQKAFPDAIYRMWVKSTWGERLRKLADDHVPFAPMELFIHCKDSTVRTALAHYASPEDAEIQDAHLAVLYDVTEQRRADAAVKRQKEYLQAIFETEPECVKVVGADGVLEDMNPAGLRMLEVDSFAEARQCGLLAFVDAEYREAFMRLHQSVCAGNTGVLEFSITGAKGTKRWLETHATPLRDENGAVVSLLGVTRDVTERKAAEDLTRKMAFYDRLTNLPNRRMLEDRLHQAIAQAQREQRTMSILFIDLDQFKQVNDDRGHESGDWLLRRVAERMQQCLRASDTAARIGGDEFVVLLPDARTIGDAVNVADKIRAALVEPYRAEDGDTLNISSSIGVVMYPQHADNPRDLLRFGDEAMYRAKKRGRNAVEVFSYAETAMVRDGQSLVHLQWKPAFECGEPSIDAEHRELFRLANSLLELAVKSDTRPESFNRAFDDLLAHVSAHFKHEEEILRDRNYTGLGHQVEQHRLLVKHAADLRRQCEEQGISVGKLVEFLASEVVAGHMLAEDRKFYALFAGLASRRMTDDELR